MILNRTRRIVLILGVVVFVLMGLFPPWTYVFHIQTVHSEKPAGYAFIAEPPMPEHNDAPFGVKIDISRLVVQWLVLSAATSLCIFMTGPRKKE